jgi:cysteinyl-tRNA synthetase
VHIYDSKTKDKIALENNEIRLYVCGPTVYDDAHLGHARSAVAFDLLVRTLRALGKKVIFARNITDIDDKILKKMNDTGKSLEEITTRYYESYKNELAKLNCLAPNIEPKATECVQDMLLLIQTLIEKGYAYKTASGDVYFDATKDDGYLSLSGHKIEDAVSRIGQSEKRGEKDFVLWKSTKEGEKVSFASPFGQGRPGWHIECSAMIKKYLAKDGAYQIDIHGGGSDLLFPHHENEAAQSRCAYGQELSHIWMHNGFVTIGGEKMSKSLGNSFFLKDALAHYDGEVVRFYLLATHYRANFNFSLEDMDAAKKRLDKLYRLKKRVGDASASEDIEFKTEFLDALKDDLNISKALAAVDMIVAKFNDALDKNPKDKEAKSKAAFVISIVAEVLGVGSKDAAEYFQLGVSETDKASIESLINERAEAKKAKNFAVADAIRDKLKSMGVELMDSANGTVWEKA